MSGGDPVWWVVISYLMFAHTYSEDWPILSMIEQAFKIIDDIAALDGEYAEVLATVGRQL
ncbi:MAG: hypothetical protein FJ267_15930 [Planctomycetes bacterium]|nr:hypothetical protein [Planctomycetota bacterium]